MIQRRTIWRAIIAATAKKSAQALGAAAPCGNSTFAQPSLATCQRPKSKKPTSWRAPIAGRKRNSTKQSTPPNAHFVPPLWSQAREPTATSNLRVCCRFHSMNAQRADTKSSYTGSRGTHYYQTKTVVRDGKRQQVRVRKTRWRSASGRVARFFDDVLVLGSKSLPKKYTDALEPWDLSEMEPYQPQYLAGFRAEGYQVELEDAFVEARAYMDRVIHRDAKFDIGGDEQRVNSVDTQIGTLTFKHVLLPIWMAAYKYRGKTYRFVVNGRTGRVQGERPYSTIKIAIAVILGLIVAAAVGFVFAQAQ